MAARDLSSTFRLPSRDVSSQAFPVLKCFLPRTINARAMNGVTGKAWNRGHNFECLRALASLSTSNCRGRGRGRARAKTRARISNTETIVRKCSHTGLN